jgi:MFS family permease
VKAPAQPADSPSAPSNRLWTLPFFNLWLVAFGSYGSVYLLLSILPGNLHRLGLSELAIGVLINLMSATAFFSRPFAGWLAESVGRKPFVVAGALGLFLGALGLPLVRDASLSALALFAVLRVLSGLGWGGLTANAATLAGELSPVSRRGEALGLYTMAGSVALAGAPAAGLFLAQVAGDQVAFLSAAAVAGLAGIACLVLRPPPRPRKPLAQLGLASLFSRPALTPAFLLLALSMMYGGVITFLPLLAARRELGNPGLFFTVYAVALAVLRGVAGSLSDRHGRPAVILPGLICGCAAMGLLAVAESMAAMLVAALLLAAAMGFVQPPALAWGIDLSQGRRATAMATMIMAQDLGIILGGVVLGAVGTLFGDVALFGIGALPGLAGLGALMLLSRRGSRPESTPGIDG